MEKSQDCSNLLMSKTCSEFSELLSAKISMPGGGSAASLAGSLGAALCSMAANFTIGKKNYESVQDDVKEILQKSEKIRVRFLELADEDAKAFPELSAAYKIPKDNPNRNEIYKRAALNACKAPVEMIECCAEAIDLLYEIMNKGNKMLISDSGCGALLCRAAMECAAMNVIINTSSLKDCEEARDIEAKIDALIKEYSVKASEISEKVNAIIRK